MTAETEAAEEAAWFPEGYGQETADAICEQLADGKSLRSICLADKMPCQVTVFKWLANNETFAKQYARAREAQADAIFDECLDIADDGANDYMGEDEKYNGDAVARSKLRIDTRKWMAGKLRPKVYGEKLELAGPGSEGQHIHEHRRTIHDPGHPASSKGVPAVPATEPL